MSLIVFLPYKAHANIPGFLKVELSPTKNKLFYFLQWKPVKNSEKCFLFHLKSSPENISTLFQPCLLVEATSRRGTTSNQRWKNVLYFYVEIYNVEQHQINVLYFKLTWTTSDNVETALSFSTSSFTMLVNVETTLRNWTKKRTNIIISNRIQEIQSFNYYFVIFTFLPMLRVIFWRVLAKLRKFLKDYEKYCIART